MRRWLGKQRIGQTGANKTEIVVAGFACACPLLCDHPQRYQSLALDSLFDD
jgi:hypothetical protein